MPRNPKLYPCGHPVRPDDSTLGLCPRCLIQKVLGGDPQGLQKAGEATWVAPRVDEVRAEFAGLELVELLGHGGMGAVYKARQLELGRPVAVKLFPCDPAWDPALLERFRHEARVLAQLSHPNIVRVYDSGHSSRYWCFVMELVAGPTLREKLQAGPLDATEALDIAGQVCEALDYAHRRGAVHRDIKPENILFEVDDAGGTPAEGDGGRARVRVADFGLAKLLRRGPSDFTLTGPGQLLGTFHYMAPEQTHDPQHVDHRADIYALGVVLYEMLTGELPIGRFPPPSAKGHVGRELDDVVLRCLEKDPEGRFQSAWELREALGRCLASPAKARPGALARKGRWVAGVGGLAIAVAAAALLLRPGATGPRRAAPRSDAPSTALHPGPTSQTPGKPPAPPDDGPFLAEFLVPYAHLTQPRYASFLRGRESFLKEMATKHGRSHIAMFWVHGLPGDVATYVHDQVMAIVGTTRCDGIGAFDSLNIVVAPVDDFESLASKVTFGRVTSVDYDRKIIRVQADPSRLPPRLPAEVMDPEAPGFYSQSLDDLGCWDRHRRLRVAVRLVDAPPAELRREIAAALEALLKDPSAQTRKVAAQALGTWGDAANLPALRAVAESQEGPGAEAARQAIAEIERRRP